MNKEINAGSNRILVVDDTTANRQLLTNLLTEQGYIVHPASDGELALEFVKSTLPDLILLDIRMPGIDGYEVCRRLKADERTRSIPVIFISVSEDERDKVKGFQAGAVDYITKPFQSAEVLARIQTHLRLRELTERLERKVEERTEELHTANAQLQRELAERRRAENALRKSEAEYRRIVDTASEGIWVLGPDTITTFVNVRMADMLGYKAEEILGRRPTDFMFKEDVTDYLQKMENSRKGIPEHYERRFRRKSGQTIWTLAAATPIFDDEHHFQGSFAMFTDITEHKQYEERQRDFYRRTILAATEGKLQLTEKEEIERIAGPAMAVYKVGNAEDFHNIRNDVAKISHSVGIDESRAGEYVIAVGEAITNAVKHANTGTVTIHILPKSIFTIILDRGPGIEAMSIPEVALKKGYTTAGTLGMGFKVMTTIADKVYLATGPWGTAVGIEMNIKPSEVMPDIDAMYHTL
jgi:PAS domain S-box-containing protein